MLSVGYQNLKHSSLCGLFLVDVLILSFIAQDQLISVVARCKNFSMASKKIFNMLYTPLETQGRTLKGKPGKPALPNQEKLETI